MQSSGESQRGWRSFARLWAVMLVSYAAAKLVFNYATRGWVDLRPVFFEELLLLPLGQTVVYWAVTRGKAPAAAVRAAGIGGPRDELQ